ncbi:MAG: methionine adenosyltransferase [Candidatus Thiodiazotropha sp. (ex Ctena orbiculata)]|nr:methionine adenosyltransferase [Candidatus Thiodiazotropha taylori]
MKRDYIFTSESVTAGHPDKLCDRISDEIVDSYLRQDPAARVRAVAAVSGGVLFLAVRFLSTAHVDISQTARDVVAQVGYLDGDFNASDCTVMTNLLSLRPDRLLSKNIETLPEDRLDTITVSNEATLFGYACNQTETLMPLPIFLAHALTRQLDRVCADHELPYLLPDASALVGVAFKDRQPIRIHSITLVVCQREANTPIPRILEDDLQRTVIEPVFRDLALKPDAQTQILVNPEGPLVGGGPMFHSGLTGHKIAMDAYGEFGRQGGSALSGKDPLRIDRVGAYTARYVAKQIVAAGLADQCEVQLSYSIGHARPVSLQIETFGSAKLPEEEIQEHIHKLFDFRLASIIRYFRLQSLPMERGMSGFYGPLAVYGHFGRQQLDLPWERLDLVDRLKALAF